MRGMLKQLATRIYFPDEAAANAEDPILKLVPAARRATLIAEAARARRWSGTSCCRARTKRCSSTSEPLSLELLFADEVCAGLLSDEKLLAAMARFEGALARASPHGLVPAAHAEVISRVCERARFDADGARARRPRAARSPFPSSSS